MGSFWSNPKRELEPEPEPEPEKVPPPPPRRLFASPPVVAHTRMLVPAYERTFGKLSRRSLFEDYFNQAGGVSAGVRLKPPEGDSNVNLTANDFYGWWGGHVRWQSDSSDEHDEHCCFLDYLVSTSKPMLQLRSYASFGGLGAFGSIPLDMENGKILDDRVMGLRYDTGSLSAGASFVPFPSCSDGELLSKIPYNNAWLVGRIGGLTAGVQYKPLGGSEHSISFEDVDLKNWNCAISYGMGSTSPVDPLFNFSLELVRSTHLVASFYHHQVLNKYDPSYIDLGLELATRLGKKDPTDSTSTDNSLFQIAACWQDDNLLLKGKIGPSKSSVALAVKNIRNSLFTFSVTAMNDHSNGTRAYGFGIHADNRNL